MPQVSIIVPVYKTEKYLKRCIDSILAQSFTDFELILVDDGSPDQSGAICDAYAVQDSRVKVVHQKNKGVSSARNAGLNIAQSQYIMFCDSDDVVAPTWIEHLIYYASPDVLPISSYCSTYDELGKRKKLKSVIEKENVAVSEYYTYNQAGIAGFLCNALYEIDIILDNKIFFRRQKGQGDYNEDLLFALSYVTKIKKIVYTGYADYWYDVHKNSLSHAYSHNYFEKYAEKYQLWGDFVAQASILNKKQCQKELATTFLYHALLSLQKEVEESSLRSENHYRNFFSMVHSPVLQKCISEADLSNENRHVLFLIQHKYCLLLWMFFKFVHYKKKWRK